MKSDAKAENKEIRVRLAGTFRLEIELAVFKGYCSESPYIPHPEEPFGIDIPKGSAERRCIDIAQLFDMPGDIDAIDHRHRSPVTMTESVGQIVEKGISRPPAFQPVDMAFLGLGLPHGIAHLVAAEIAIDHVHQLAILLIRRGDHHPYYEISDGTADDLYGGRASPANAPGTPGMEPGIHVFSSGIGGGVGERVDHDAGIRRYRVLPRGTIRPLVETKC